MSQARTRLVLTGLVGRADELIIVRDLLGQHRLVTLVGPGGIGKTRLALELLQAPHRAGAPDHPVVELASVADPALVPLNIAHSLGVREQAGRDVTETLAEALQERRLLLLLDNCEHVLDACAQAALHLLETCPGVRILATSREPLGIVGELVWRVPVLNLQHSSELFVARAQSVEPTFRATAENAPAIMHICQRLDGIPLAIELAAAWVRALSPHQIATRLDDRWPVLAGGSRTSPARHRTMRATIEWSYTRLEAPAQLLFDRLSVFAGHCDIDAVERICAGEDLPPSDVLPTLTQLIDKSLVVSQVSAGQSEARYRVLETLREFGHERLVQRGELDRISQRHATYYRDLVERAEPRFDSSRLVSGLDRQERELENVRTALRWFADTDAVEQMARMAAALWRFWFFRGYVTEGFAWLQRLANRASEVADLEVRARVLTGAGLLARVVGDYSAADTWLRNALSLWRDRGRGEDSAHVLHQLGLVAHARGDYAAAREFLEAGIVESRSAGSNVVEGLNAYSLSDLESSQGEYDAARERAEVAVALLRTARHQLGLGSALLTLGLAELHLGDLVRARLHLEESLALHRQRGDAWWTARALDGLARLALQESDLAHAHECLEEAIPIFWDVRDRQGLARALEGIAVLAMRERRPERALHLIGAASGLRASIGAPLSPADEEHLAATLADVTAAFDTSRVAELMVEGQAMSAADLVQYAIQHETAPAPSAPGPVRESILSGREREVAGLVAQGLSNLQIAHQLVIGERTVESHVSHALSKLGLTSRAALAAWAATHT